nr:MAG TPA: hypothetical protein [Caudoviricetes sp.]
MSSTRLTDDPGRGERRSWRRFVRRALSDKAKVLLHHWSDGCRCGGELRAHVPGKSCFGCRPFAAAVQAVTGANLRWRSSFCPTIVLGANPR